MSFGGAGVPDGYVMRSFRAKVMATPAKKKRAMALLVSSGDVWAWCIDRCHERLRAGLPNANSPLELRPDQRLHGPFGELTAHCAQDVTKAWSTAFFAVMRQRAAGERAALPLRKRHLLPVTWRKGEFSLSPASPGRRARVELCLKRGAAHLVLALSHEHAYEPDLVRAVRLERTSR